MGATEVMARVTIPDDEAVLASTGATSLRRRLSTFAVIGLTSAAIIAAAYLSNQPTQATTTLPDGTVTSITVTGTATGDPPTVGRTAPPFTALTADGKAFDLGALKGRPVWLTFGATWCQPCRAENPDIETAYLRYKDQGLAVVQVYITEDAKVVNDYADRVGLTYTRVPDPTQRLAAEYRILGIPTHYFIGRDGVLKVLRIGSLTDELIASNLATILE
jgi:thiol-disulfide isomerase/thioredoxin